MSFRTSDERVRNTSFNLRQTTTGWRAGCFDISRKHCIGLVMIQFTRSERFFPDFVQLTQIDHSSHAVVLKIINFKQLHTIEPRYIELYGIWAITST